MVAQIVRIGTRGDHVDPELPDQPGKPPVELALAEVAAIRLIAEVVRVCKFLGTDHAVADTDPAGQFLGLLELSSGQAVRNRRHGNRGIPNRRVRRLSDDCAVNPS